MDLKKYFSAEFKNIKTAKILFGASVLIAMFFLALKPPSDPDLFEHLKSGELIWQYKIIPQTDWFSYTMNDYAYVDFEWLSEILMSGIRHIAGFGGLAIFFALIITLSFGYLIPQSIKNRPFFVTCFLSLAGTVVSSLTFGSRAQMFTILGLSLIFFIIAKYKTGSDKIVWFLPPLFLLWANMHGGFVLGLILIATILLLENFLINNDNPKAEWRSLYNPMNREKWIKLLHSSAISFVLTFLNPYTWRLYKEIYYATTDDFDKNNIIEWLSPNFHTNEGLIFGFYVIFFIIIVSLIKKIDVLSFVLVPFFLFFAFQSARNIPFFVIVTLPFLVNSMADFENIFSDLFKKKLVAVGMSIFLIFNIPFNLNAADIIKTFNNSEKLAEAGGFPDQAMRFLFNNPAYRQKNIFNNYGWGGYLIQNSKCGMKNEKLWCEPKVFIDGRMSFWNLPDRRILKDYTDIHYLSDNWEKIITKYNIQIIFIDKKSSLAKNLKLNNGWKKIYEDDLAVIYEKNEIK